MQILSSVAATSVLASATSNAGVESGELNPTREAPESNVKTSKVVEKAKVVAPRVDQSDSRRC